MINSQDFSRIIYKNPEKSLTDKRPSLSKIIGFDSEAYTSGVPFMFSTSLNEIIKPENLLDTLFEERYINANFMLYNIKYDSGAILYSLQRDDLHHLWEYGKVKVNDFNFSYIPHKQLRISKGKDVATFWDVAQFYKHGGHRLTLDSAAKLYLNESKKDLRTKRFTVDYVKKYWKSISEYAIHDAVLAGKLGEYLVNKLDEFGITPTAIYSCASVSFKYFCDHAKIVTSWKYWNEDRELLKFACDAYEGGKFEVTARGKFTGYEYDISSAYPYEIANLIDISNAIVIRTKQYQSDAIYGFIRCLIDNRVSKHLPCGMMNKNVRIYPAGLFYLTITKQEFDYITNELNLECTIIDAYWLMVKRKSYPYKSVIATLYNLKSHFKKTDKMLYDITKIVQNSFYGKTCQAIEMPDNKVRIGAGWNPVYASVITANTRIKVTKIQNLMKEKCLAVHTDSVIITEKLSDQIPQDGKLGNFEYVIEGSGIIIACGMYQIADQCAFKGFKPKKNDTWESILLSNFQRKKIKYRFQNVESWVEVMAKNHDKDRINLFQQSTKIIDLNCDCKRIWDSETNAKQLINTSEQSGHKIIMDKERPSFWY